MGLETGFPGAGGLVFGSIVLLTTFVLCKTGWRIAKIRRSGFLHLHLLFTKDKS